MDEETLKRRQDSEDFNNEAAGAETGRMARFFTGEDAPRNVKSAREKARKDRAFKTQLDLFLLDPEYAALHRQATDLTNKAQDKLNAAMDRVTARIEHLESVAEDMDAGTATLPDGTPVFIDEDGNLRTADGGHLREADTASLLNPENIKSYERRRDVRDALTSARARLDELCKMQDGIDHARRRLEDEENPADKKEVREIRTDLDDIIERMDKFESVQSSFNAAVSSDSRTVIAGLDFTSLGASAP